MEDLMAKVVKKLQERQKQFHQTTYSDTLNAPEIQVFVDNANVDVMTTSVQFIADLYGLRSDNSWVAWVMKGFEYDVKFRFEVSEYVAQFIPIKMILDWPLLFVIDAKHPVYSSRSRLISRSEIANLADQSVLILTHDQRVTSEAKELIRTKNIQLQVRSDAECIWQK